MELKPRPSLPKESGSFTAENAIVYYDETGIITNVVKRTVNSPRSMAIDETTDDTDIVGSNTPAPLIDMYKLSMKNDGTVTRDIFGDDIQIYVDAGGKVLKLQTPDYIVSESQINVNGAYSWEFHKNEKHLAIKLKDYDSPVTVAFRG